MSNTTSNDIFNTERLLLQGQTIPLSMFNHKKDSGENGFFNDQNHCISYQEFGATLEWFATQPFAGKEKAPLMSPTVYRLQRALGTNGKWCIVYRCKANATLCRLLFLDSDHAALSFEAACEVLAGHECFVYTTASHQADRARVRLVVPMADMVGYETHKCAVAGLSRFVKERLGVAEWKCDTGKLNAYSLFYVPGQYASASENKFVYLPGDIQPAEYWLSQYPDPYKENTHEALVMAPLQYTLSDNLLCNPYDNFITQIASYRMKKEDRYNGLWNLAVSLAMSAINKGYRIRLTELADIILEEQRRNPPSAHCYTREMLLNDKLPSAVHRARRNVSVPAFVRAEQVIEERMAEMRAYFQEEETI